MPNRLSPPIKITNSFNNLSNVNLTFYIRKENFKPSIEWAKDKIEISLKSIGNRYITFNNKDFKDLNIKLSIHDILNSVTNTSDNFDFSNFYSSLNNFDYSLAIGYIESGAGVKREWQDYKDLKQYFLKDKQLIFEKDLSEDEYVKYVYYNFSEEIEILLKFYSCYTDLLSSFSNVDSLKSNFFHKNTITLLEQIDKLYSQIQHKPSMRLIDKHMGPSGPYTVEKISKIKKRAQWIYDKNIKDLKKILIDKNFDNTEWINQNNILSTFLFKYSLVTGEAMSGKTHLLSNIAEKRIQNNKPTILIYAQKFDENLSDTPIQHAIKQLGLEKYQLTDEEFLNLLNEWGKESNEFVLFIIDAINETPNKLLWRNDFIEFVSKVQKYPYISLLMSIRDVEKKTTLTDNIQTFIKSNMIEVIHKGFETIEYPILKKFCQVFKINLPTFPFISPIFSNPGLLFLFFETLKRNNINEIDEKVLKPNFIIHEYIQDRNNHFKELYNIIDRRTFIIRSTNKISSKIVSNGFIEDVKYDDVYTDLYKIHEHILDYLISEGILLENINQVGDILLYFSYQRFGNYFIAIYLLSDSFSNTNIPHKDILYSLFSNYEQHQAIIEALIIRLSENYKLDFIDIFPELFDDENLNNIRYKCFAQSLTLPETIENKINKILYLNHDEQSNILELLLKTAHEQSNDLNIKVILNPLLLSLGLMHREVFWSVYINNSFNEEGIVKIIIDWALNKKEDFIIEDNSLVLYGITLGWFLCSSNRELRDKTTKALVNIFTNNTEIFLEVLKEFEPVNDLYILERLYAVAYGIVLRSINQNGFKELAEYIYNKIFNVDIVIEHILIRDYAKLTIEYIFNLIDLDIDIDKVKPPYTSILPDSFPTDEEIDSYENVNIEINKIISSMVTVSGRSENNMYGDFGRYTFQSNLTNFKLEDLKVQSLSNYAVKIIIDEMLDNKEFFSQAESSLKNKSYSRYEHKIERIGKKYQWIAFYKVLAIVADNFHITDSSSWNDKTEKYIGTIQLSCRNIDPTSILLNKVKNKSQWWLNINKDFEHLELSDIDWMKSREKLPKVSELLTIHSQNKDYLLLDTSFSIDGNKVTNKYRNLYYCINSFIVKKDDLTTLISWAHKQTFYANKMPTSSHFYKVFLREYPFSKAYESINNYYNSQMSWETTFDDKNDALPCAVLPTATSYMNEASGYDSSVENAIEIKLPNKWLIENMNLVQSLNDGEWINENKDVVFTDIGNNDEDIALLAHTTKLLEFLNNKDYTIFWVIWGEKQVRDTQDGFNEKDFLGVAQIDGFAYLQNNQIFESPINLKYDRI